MRAGRFDIVVETGAAYNRAVELLRPDVAIPASTVTPGTYVYLDGWPRPVYSVATASGVTTLKFNQGLWSDPSLSVDANALVQPGVPMAIVDARAAFRISTDPSVNPPLDVVIPVVVAPDALSCEIDMSADLTSTFVAFVGAHSWDMYAKTNEWDWQRVLEGTFVVVEGDAR